MLFFRKELKDKYPSTYQLNNAISKNKIYKIEEGLYSNKKQNQLLEILTKKYPEAVFTLDSAFYYHNLTDVIPNQYYLATKRNSTRIKNNKVKQIFIPNELFDFGIVKMKIENMDVNIYDKERLLVELLRKKNQLPFDYYKEIVNNYREIAHELDMHKIDTYISKYKNSDTLYDTLQREIL